MIHMCDWICKNYHVCTITDTYLGITFLNIHCTYVCSYVHMVQLNLNLTLACTYQTRVRFIEFSE